MKRKYTGSSHVKLRAGDMLEASTGSPGAYHLQREGGSLWIYAANISGNARQRRQQVRAWRRAGVTVQS